jgi:hypothetical protein
MNSTRRDFLKIAAGTGVAMVGGLRPVGGQLRRPLRDVVILLPGIMGSVLQKDGRDVWAFSGGAIVSGVRSLGGSISSLALTGDSPTAEDLGDGISATRLIPDTHLIPGFWKIDGYSAISNYITTRFDAQRGRNFFEFPYDWRRDNRVAARRLARQSRQWLEDWRTTSGNANARLIIVAHSMGGLVSRYFLEVLNGWRETRMLVTFGTPYRGSLKALDFLANGIRKRVGPFTLVDVSSLVRSFTSAYQLLPIYRCYDPGSGVLARVGETSGIPNVNARRASEALAFHNEILDAVQRNATDAVYARDRYTVHPIIGTYQPTLQSARLANGSLQGLQTLGNDASLRGDGTVPQASARPIETAALEKQHRMVYVAEVHGSLQNSSAVLDHLGGLLEEGAIAWDRFRATDGADVAVIVDDVYATSERVIVGAHCDIATTLAVSVVNTASGMEVVRASLSIASPGSSGETAIGPLPEGTYRVTVRGGDNVKSATDVFIVVSDDK